MKLKYFIKEEKRVYTFKEKDPNNNNTLDAHYRFTKIRDAPTNN